MKSKAFDHSVNLRPLDVFSLFLSFAGLPALFFVGCAMPQERHDPDATGVPAMCGYTWKTLAGQLGGLGNVDGLGGEARFCQPLGVAYDQSGNLYVADYYNYAIRKIAPDGRVSTLTGCVGEPGGNDGTGNSARFDRPMDVAVDAAGNVYVADNGNHVIRKVTSEGVATTFAGRTGEQGCADGVGREARFRSPSGLTVDGAGNVIVADTGNHAIRKITPSGKVTTLAGKCELKNGSPVGSFSDGEAGGARFRSPRDVAVDASGCVYVADTENAVVRKIKSDGTVSTLAGSAGKAGTADGSNGAARFNGPLSVAVDQTGNLYVVDSGCQMIRKITSAGGVTSLTNSAARFASPRGVAVDRAGYLAVSDNDAQTISRISPSGGVTVWAGSASSHGHANGVGAAARFNRPTGISVDRQRNVYVTDNFTQVIRKIAPDGVVTTLAGRVWNSGADDGKGGMARFNWPCGAAQDRAGNLYVADAGNHTIRKVASDGTVTTLAGSAGTSGSADGTAAKARFSSPSGVSLDSRGNVYVADRGNHTVRKITPSGAVTTVAGSAEKSGRADGGGAVARFNSPTGVAVDMLDNVYVADTGNHVILRIIPGGEVTTLAGCAGMKGYADGKGIQARFNGPSAVALDLTGNLIVADRDNHMVRMVTPEGVVTTLGGAPNRMSGADGFGMEARFAQPSGVAVDCDGVIYVADACNNRVVAGYWSDGLQRPASPPGRSEAGTSLSPHGVNVPNEPYTWEVFVGQPGEPGSEDGRGCEARLRAPQGIAIGNDEVLYVADGCDNTVRRITREGVVSTLPGTRDRIVAPVGIAVGSDDGCLLTDTSNVLWKLGTDGTLRRLAGGANQRGDSDGIGGAARFSFIPGLAIDRSAHVVYVVDHNNYTVRKMAPDGTVTTFAGRAGDQGCFDGRGGAARFMLPVGLAVDAAGCVWVADDNKVRKITPDGEVSTLRGQGVKFGRLDGIALDRAGNVYVADRDEHVVWKVTQQGRVSRLGSSGLAMGGNGWLVTGLAVDRDARVYVSDSVRNCIIRGTPQRSR